MHDRAAREKARPRGAIAEGLGVYAVEVYALNDSARVLPEIRLSGIGGR